MRPHGIDAPAAPRFADAIEALAARRPAPPTATGRAARAVLAPVAARLPERRPAAPDRRPAEPLAEDAVLPAQHQLRPPLRGRAARAAGARAPRPRRAGRREEGRAPARRRCSTRCAAQSPAFTYGLVPPPTRRALGRVRRGRAPRDRLPALPGTGVRGRRRAARARRAAYAARGPRGDAAARASARRRAVARWAPCCGRSRRRVPIDRTLRAFVHEQDPDLVLVSPLVGLGSPQGDYVRAARRGRRADRAPRRELGQPDEQGRDPRHPRPDGRLERAAGARGGRDCTAFPATGSRCTGAHTYDHWFDWRPSSTREEFCARVGLDREPPVRPLRLLVALHRAGRALVPGALDRGAPRRRPIPWSGTAAILIRPHPANAAAVGPVRDRGARPTSPSGRGTATGRSTPSARPTTTTRSTTAAPSWASTRARRSRAAISAPAGAHRAGAGLPRQPAGHAALRPHRRPRTTGLLSVASDLEEHLAQLADAIGPDTAHDAAQSRRFLEHFVRPLGLAEPAAPQVVEALERCAARRVPARTRSRAQAATAAALSPIVHVGRRRCGRGLGIGSAPVRSRAVAVGDGTGPLHDPARTRSPGPPDPLRRRASAL